MKKEQNHGVRIAIFTISILLEFAVGAILFAVALPKYFGEKCPNISQWLFSSVEKLTDRLGISVDEAAAFVTTIIIFKILFWVLTGAIVVSLFFLGSAIHNKKPSLNLGAHVYDRSAYILALEIFNSIPSNISEKVTREIITISEKLRTESDFGRGNNEVTHCENEIYRSLNELKLVISSVSSGHASEDDIITICHFINGKLALRRELTTK